MLDWGDTISAFVSEQCVARDLRFLPGAELSADIDQELATVQITLPGNHPQFKCQTPQVPDSR